MKKAKAVYLATKNQSKKRNIDFKLSFEEWYSWWLDNGIDKNGPSQKAKGIPRKEVLSMCRYNDIGPYALDNIYCATVSENSRSIDKFKHKFARKPISTSQGNFPSIKAWCLATGKTYDDWKKTS